MFNDDEIQNGGEARTVGASAAMPEQRIRTLLQRRDQFGEFLRARKLAKFELNRNVFRARFRAGRGFTVEPVHTRLCSAQIQDAADVMRLHYLFQFCRRQLRAAVRFLRRHRAKIIPQAPHEAKQQQHDSHRRERQPAQEPDTRGGKRHAQRATSAARRR